MASSNSAQPATYDNCLRKQQFSTNGKQKPASSASIPSKFQTIVIKNNEKKGFNSGSKRFEYQHFSDSPGPAQYKLKQTSLKDNSSFSKKGLGGFVSKVKRFPTLTNESCNLGPGQYSLDHKIEHYFNRADCTSNFHKPIAVMNRLHKFKTPAPNQYYLNQQSCHTNNVCNAAFLSRTKRELVTANASNKAPAPGTYEINENLTKPTPRVAYAPFRSTTKRDFLSKEILRNPGPGSYNPYELVDTSMLGKHFPRKHCLCISAPAAPMPKDPPTPGPGHYNLVNYENPSKEYGRSSMFISTTNRWNGSSDNQHIPGPTTYNPRDIMKQSFLYNARQKWI